ncbi:hypothetical protein J6590_000696 [Homalodisca vitripennis]|nr:hypothetical protein J6590_000696 [Homalodisca vitripennis]
MNRELPLSGVNIKSRQGRFQAVHGEKTNTRSTSQSQSVEKTKTRRASIDGSGPRLSDGWPITARLSFIVHFDGQLEAITNRSAELKKLYNVTGKRDRLMNVLKDTNLSQVSFTGLGRQGGGRINDYSMYNMVSAAKDACIHLQKRDANCVEVVAVYTTQSIWSGFDKNNKTSIKPSQSNILCSTRSFHHKYNILVCKIQQSTEDLQDSTDEYVMLRPQGSPPGTDKCCESRLALCVNAAGGNRSDIPRHLSAARDLGQCNVITL